MGDPSACCLFLSPTSELTPTQNLHMSWNTARTKAGLAWFRVHEFRHQYASRMILDGNSDILAVSTLLGHSSVRQSKRYSYLTKSHMVE